MGRLPAWAAGPILIVAILAVQAAVFSRMVGTCETKRAEQPLEQLSPIITRLESGLMPPAEAVSVVAKCRAVLERVKPGLERALATDSTNGWAYWLLSKAHMYDAVVATARKDGPGREAHLAKAEELAHRGALRFNSVGCFKQLASICLRQERIQDAETYLQIVTRVKPDDIEAAERLGLIKLTLKKWDDLRWLCEQILEKHPYSANAYFYKAFIAQEEKNDNDKYVYTRQAYLMMKQNMGEIFFNRANLQQMAVVLKVAEALKDEGVRPSP
jgi:exonuclease VII small subunit